MPKKMTKEDWVAMFRDIGLNDETMMRWHQLFEARHPQSHAEFLAWLGLSTEEIDRVRSLAN